jgi:Fic family protein
MKLKDFKSGRWIKQYQYRSFSPNKVNHEWSLDDDMVISLLSKANILLGELKGNSKRIPNVDFFIKMHILKEATSSSEIEGTQTNLEEVLQKVENIAPEKRDDWIEVHNYIDAMNFAITELQNLPLCNRLLRETHKILMQGVRGQNKQPGEFRTSQNWIGGRSLSDAHFVPPYHTEVIDLMSDLEIFLQNDEISVPSLIKIAIAHYQFETIHPFLDGNGRIGRLLITLFLVNEKILPTPTLYLSDFLSRHRSLYFDNLMICREKSNMTQWLRFFLSGIIDTAEISIRTLDKILDIQTDIDKNKITMFSRSRIENAQKFMEYLYRQPIVDVSDIMETLRLTDDTSMRLIKDFIKCGILYEMTGRKRNQIFVFKDYLGLFH